MTGKAIPETEMGLAELTEKASNMENQARLLARSHQVVREPGARPILTEYLQKYQAILRDAVHFFRSASDADLALSYAAEWMLDNYHVVRLVLRQIEEDLPPRYYSQLPKLTEDPLAGYPRVYALSRVLVSNDRAHLEMEHVNDFIRAYQVEAPLNMGELWALPIMLRYTIIETLVLAVGLITGVWSGENHPLPLVELPAGVAEDEVVANCIISLRTLGVQDWKDFFENLSLVELLLNRDPAGIYPDMDFDTRDRYRKVVEEISLASGISERQIAWEVVRLAQESLDNSETRLPHHPAGLRAQLEKDTRPWQGFAVPRRVHVGYYLIDRGRKDLERSLGLRPPWRLRLASWLLEHPTLAYLGSVSLLTLVLWSALVIYALGVGSSPLQAILVGLLVLIPAVTVGVSLVNWTVTRVLKPRVLPKMDFDSGLPGECATMVAVPALLAGSEDVRSLMRQLELHYLRNPDPYLFFALLTDFNDAPQEHMPCDEQLLDEILQGVRALNQRYRRTDHNPFYLFHRKRVWNPSEGVWMGWERKRGKLYELNRMILHGERGSFEITEGDLEFLPNIRYVITLDADTILPGGSARRLVATMAHPLNQAEFDPQTGAVTAGYTVLQPRTEINPASAKQSLFTRVFAGDTGLDLYTLAVSDVYQDLFGEGIYVGKGIYDVAAFEHSLEGRVPENALLSHDLFEGIHGRAGLLTDVTLIEDYPSHYLAFVLRAHRWARGDWQLLPWLFPRVPSASGEKIPNRLSLISRWKILDNLRRSLVSPAILALLVSGWLWLPGRTLVWTLAALFALGTPLFTGTLDGLLQAVRGVVLKRAALNVRDGAIRWLLAIAFLPHEALLVLDAITTTLYRVIFSRRKLLQWTTAAHTASLFRENPGSRVTWKHMLTALVLSVGLGLLVWFFHPYLLLQIAPFLIAWLFSPEIASWISRPIRRQQSPLSEAQRLRLRSLARQTWMYFEHFVGPEDHWLAPDHYQESPLGVVAHRTSPTNLGLSLISALGAFDLGYTGFLDLAARLRSSLDHMDSLERYRGHFLNWYDTRTLDPLPPRYVSTVDSGNLAACLITLAVACRQMSQVPVFRWETWEAMADLLELLEGIMERLEETEVRETAVDLRGYLSDTRQRVLSIQDKPHAWPDMLLQTSGEILEECENRLLYLVENAAHLMSAEDLSRLRIYTRRLRLHLENTRREVHMLVPWVFEFGNPPQPPLPRGAKGGSEPPLPRGAKGGSEPSLSTGAKGESDPSLVEEAKWGSEPPLPRGAKGGLPAAFESPDLPEEARAAFLELKSALLSNPRLGEIEDVYNAGVQKIEAMRQRLSGWEHPSLSMEEIQHWLDRLQDDLETAKLGAKALMIGFADVANQAKAYVDAMDFSFLFDRHRQVFHIGYNVALEKLDGNKYDLLASEARIASLVAIAKGDIPLSHWLHLARPMTSVDGSRALLSWSATMFEYLMPALFQRSFDNTLLHQSSLAAIEHQIAYGRSKNVPWGISESGYYRFDANQFYQYRAFGAPGLGYKRGLAEDLVVAPYASLLALPWRPHEVVENIERLESLGAIGIYGFYEAVDFTSSRLPVGEKYKIVRSYMAHHQGMILTSIVNYLKEDIMVRRFHEDARIQSVEMLLQEQIPLDAPVEYPLIEDSRVVRPSRPKVINEPWRVRVHTPQPRLASLSNGRYHVMITNTGSGTSRWGDVDLTRWRPDTSLNQWGNWIYIQVLEGEEFSPGYLSSATYQPAAFTAQSWDVYFETYMASFRRRDRDLSVSLEVTVPSDDDMEVRRVSLTNHANRPRRVRVASYAEVVLASQAEDERHPAFNKLFIESEWLAGTNTLLFRRRPRSQEEDPLYLAHILVLEQNRKANPIYETDRARFLGRKRTPRDPQAFTSQSEGAWLSGTVGATLDPIMSIGQEIELEPHATCQLAYITIASESRQEAIKLAGRMQAWHLVERSFDQARTYSEVELRQTGLDSHQVERIQQLLSVLVYPYNALRADTTTMASNRKGQPGLWAYGISGDFPILLLRLGDAEELSLLHELLQAHRYWRERGFKIDLVILNKQGSDYGQELAGQVHSLLRRMNADNWLNRRGGIFLLNVDQLGEGDLTLIETAARAILDGEAGPLARQLSSLDVFPDRLPPFYPTRQKDEPEEDTPALPRPQGLQFDNGLGGFSPDGREYVIYLSEGVQTPAPWSNVVANPEFGFLVTESGGGFTWHLNSGENRLTPWSNDPVTDTPGEALYLRDEETGRVWSPTPSPAGDNAPYLVRHGAGYTIFEHQSQGLKQSLRMFVPPDASVKIVQLRLENLWKRPRRITATCYAEWVLGANRSITQQYIVPEFDQDHRAILARNPFNPEFAEKVAFLSASKDLHGLTADRAEFLGRLGDYTRPAALKRIGLSGSVQAGLDPCAALQLHVDLPEDGVEEMTFILGQGANRQAAEALIERFQDPGQVARAWEATGSFWDELLDAVTVETPDPAMNLLLNRWLLYQALSCRIWGRSAFYQSSGAYGFRDQLQDVLSLTFTKPELARQHLLRAASCQFKEGDVLHWWHPPGGQGVRTRYSDDLLWLPYAVLQYVETTGDEAVLDDKAPFLTGPLLKQGEKEIYGRFTPTRRSYPLYEHCRRAIEKGSTSGPHRLPLMGGGDWNDSMNRVGIEGRGESVWLGWFLYDVLTRFACLARRRGDEAHADLYTERAESLRQALEDHAWDGAWYLRAFYDDGSPLGSSQNRECKIDSLSQSWAVLSRGGDPGRVEEAMRSVFESLAAPDDGLILLFKPPFDKTPRDPGYIKGYAPGIRENGGQYTHAALWVIWAYAQMGDGDIAEQLFRMINPIYHADTAEKATRYRVEPYVIAADVYSAPPHNGRGGWTWYTGSSGWMYRLGVEAILGLRRQGQAFVVDPCIPSIWKSYHLTYRTKGTIYRIRVENPQGVQRGVKEVRLDGELLPDGRIPLEEGGGERQVIVTLGWDADER